jgi:hypothetical protein
MHPLAVEELVPHGHIPANERLLELRGIGEVEPMQRRDDHGLLVPRQRSLGVDERVLIRIRPADNR